MKLNMSGDDLRGAMNWPAFASSYHLRMNPALDIKQGANVAPRLNQKILKLHRLSTGTLTTGLMSQNRTLTRTRTRTRTPRSHLGPEARLGEVRQSS